jgi:WD40 repeat protein
MTKSLGLLVFVCSLCLLNACGGGSANSPPSSPPPPPATASSGFVATGSMKFARKDHAATLLRDGTVLVTGGNGSTGTLATAELFDPASGVFVLAGSMGTARAGHSATLLNDGRVLVAGGGTATAELFDPASGTFVPTGSMGTARAGHTATLLSDGRVLVTGGGSATAELFDAKTGQFVPAGDMFASRSYHTATLLSSGEVLIAGGTDSNGTALGELFDPTDDSFVPTATGGTQALHLAATSLPDGRIFLAGGEETVVLVSGGGNRCCISGPVSVAVALLFDHTSLSFSAAGGMSTSRSRLTVTFLGNGRVLVAGGANISTKAFQPSAVTTIRPLATAELFNPASSTFGATGSMITARAEHTATLLGNGKVLVAGGADANNNILATAELY